MPKIKYKIKFELDDTTFDIDNVKVENKHSGGYVAHSKKENIAAAGGLANALAKHGMSVKDMDLDFHGHCHPIMIYSRNPSCVVVGGWLFCS